MSVQHVQLTEAAQAKLAALRAAKSGVITPSTTEPSSPADTRSGPVSPAVSLQASAAAVPVSPTNHVSPTLQTGPTSQKVFATVSVDSQSQEGTVPADLQAMQPPALVPPSPTKSIKSPTNPASTPPREFLSKKVPVEISTATLLGSDAGNESSTSWVDSGTEKDSRLH